jgi:YVTN family beta-propeller protein
LLHPFAGVVALVGACSLCPATAAVGGELAYVTNYQAATVSVVDLANGKSAAEIPLGTFPFGGVAVALSRDGSHAYVAKSGWPGAVAVLRTDSNEIEATVPVGDEPFSLALSPDQHRVYVTNFSGDTVSVVDVETDTVIATIPVGHGPDGVAFSVDGTHAVVSNFHGDSVSVIDTATHAVVATIALGSVGDAPYGPMGIAMAAHECYVANATRDSVSVIDTTQWAVVAEIKVGGAPAGIALSPDGARVYVANQASDSVSVIDTATHKVVTAVAMGQGPFGIAVAPRSARVLVTQRSANSVAVIDPATLTIAATIAVGAAPYGVAVASMGDGVDTPSASDCSCQVGGRRVSARSAIAAVPVAWLWARRSRRRRGRRDAR